MRLTALFYFLLFFIAFTSSLTAQTPDTINLAQLLQQQGKYKEGAELLAAFEVDHPTNFNSKRLHALLLYWSKDFDAAEQLYQKIIGEHPEVAVIKLEYGRMLFELKEFNEAKKQLLDYLLTEPENVEPNLKLGWIIYWQGDYKEAQKHVDLILKKYPANPDANELNGKIKEIYAPWLELKEGYLHDSQPLDVIGAEVKTGCYRSRFFEPHILFNTNHFYDEETWRGSYWIQLANTMAFVKPGIRATITAGYYRHTAKTNHWTGDVEFLKTFAKHLELTAQVAREPYFLTQKSLQETVMMNNYLISAGWNDMNTWNGLVAFSTQQFHDDNYIQTFYAWLFAPPIKVAVFEFRFGGAYNFSDAQKNNFTSKKDVLEILTQYDPDAEIEGEYDPYFTPNNQHIVSALCAIRIKPTKSIRVDLNANVGAYAKADIPYLFLNKNESGDIFIDKGYSKETKVTLDLKAMVSYSPTQNVTLQGQYGYFETFFFTSHSAALSCKIIFLHAKK